MHYSDSILLQSLNKFTEIVYLNLATGRARWILKDDVGEVDWLKVNQLKVNGVASRIDGREVFFYRQGKNLHIRFDHEDIELDPSIVLDIKKVNEYDNRVTISKKHNVLFAWEYRSPRDDIFESDFTPFVEEEQFDICLLAYNVLRNAERRKRIFRVE